MLSVELPQEHFLNVFKGIQSVPFQMVEGLLGLANVEKMSF